MNMLSLAKQSVLAALIPAGFAGFAQAYQGIESFKEAASETAFMESAAHAPAFGKTRLFAPKWTSPPKRNRVSGSDKPGGRPLDFYIDRRFEGEYSVWGKDVDLTVRCRNRPPGSFAEYEGTGTLLGKRYPPGHPVFIRKEAFGSIQRILLEAEGFRIRLEDAAGWGELNVEMKADETINVETVSVLMTLLGALPEISFQSSSFTPQAVSREIIGGTSLSYRFRRGLPNLFYVDGAGLQIRVERFAWGFGYRYDVRGTGFGKDFDRDGLFLETDGKLLGPKGYRIRGCGIDLEIRDAFSGFSRIEVRGTTGESRDILSFALSLARYLRSQ